MQARALDRFALYERSVQTPDAEVVFIDGLFRRWRGRPARSLREDFCGSAAFAAAWCESHRERTALGIDRDAEVLAWAKQHNAHPRAELYRGDVLRAPARRFDVVVAYNYSYCVFQTRPALTAYFRAARRGLARDGLFFLDLFGGSTSQQPSIETRRMRGGYGYVWEQVSFNPIDNHFLAHIHFDLPDGGRMKRAFTYDWRLWQLVELRELLADAGFSSSHVYWEDSTKSGKWSGRFRKRLIVNNDPAWNCYLIAAA